MNYHNLTYPDQNNGDGLRVVLWLSGCDHHCYHCQNPQTWNPDSGIKFDDKAFNELFNELEQDYIAGLTLTGGDPLHDNNVKEVYELCNIIKTKYPNKTIWLYTGYTFETILNKQECSINDLYRRNILFLLDVLVDGRFEEEKKDEGYHWAGSTNQRVINIQKTLKQGKIILWN